MDSYKKMVGDRIRKRRLKLGMQSQDRLADALHKAGAKNVDQSRISRWENGTSLPAKAFRPHLLAVLGLNHNDLFSVEVDAPEPLSPGWQEASRLLDAIAEAGPLRQLIALYVATDETKYLEEIRALPGTARTVEFLLTLPRR